MANAVKDPSAAAQAVAMKSAELPADETDAEEPSVDQPDWIIGLAKRWRSHHHADLQLRFESGAEINEQIGSPKERQERGAEVVRTLSTELGLDTSEISRLRRFAELAERFEEFQTKYPKCLTWSHVKKLLAGQAETSDEDDDDDEQAPEVRGLIVRVRNIRLALKKLKQQKVTVSGRDRTELQLELEKLAETLAKRAGFKLTVAQITEEAAA